MEKQRHTVILRTLCFVFNNKNQVLLIERAAYKFDAGMYNVLGGHIKKGEDIIASAEREIFEECGLKPDVTNLMGVIHVTNFFEKNIMMFITKSVTTNTRVKESIEGKLTWVSLEEIDKYPLYDDIKPFLKKIIGNNNCVFTGTSVFDGKGGLITLSININNA